MPEYRFDRVKWMTDAEGSWLMLRETERGGAVRAAAPFRGTENGNYDAKLTEHKNRRSLDANAYLWVLIGKIADQLRKSKGEVYLDMLKDYGQGGVVKIPNRYIEHFERAFPYHEKHESLPDEKRAQYYRFWVGSSQYNTQEMSVLIDGVVQEAKALGIETATPQELALIKEGWGCAS